MEHEKKEVSLSETTLRKIISDYIYHRPKHKNQMKWESEYSDIIFCIHLEEKPFSQESLGYELKKEI